MNFVRCGIDKRRCPMCQKADDYEEWWGLCPFGVYHDETFTQKVEGSIPIIYVSGTCMFMGSYRHKPPKEMRDEPLFTYNQIMQLLKSFGITK